MDTGTGKTRTALEVIRIRKVHTLIVCPLSTLTPVWLAEIQQWTPEIPCIDLHEALQKKGREPRVPDEVPAIFLINYESLKKVPRNVMAKIQFIVLDESAKIRNPGTHITQLMMTLFDMPYRLLLSGCPAPNTLLEYFPQLYFVDRSIFQPHYTGRFRSDYYRFRAINFFNANKIGGYFLPIAKRGAKESIANLVAKVAFQCSKSHCLDLPPQVYEQRFCEMTLEQAKVYTALLHHNIAEFKDSVVLGANELAKIMKLRQITSGFFIDDGGTETTLSDSKYNLLQNTLEEIGGHRVIIWCQFHKEIHRILELLGDKAVPFYGEQNVNEKNEALRRFKSGEAQYFIAHPASGGYGLNLTECCYAVYFSGSYSYEMRKQSEDRIYRAGQTQKVTYIDLIVPGTIDEVLCRAVKAKRNLSDAVLDMIHQANMQGG